MYVCYLFTLNNIQSIFQGKEAVSIELHKEKIKDFEFILKIHLNNPKFMFITRRFLNKNFL